MKSIFGCFLVLIITLNLSSAQTAKTTLSLEQADRPYVLNNFLEVHSTSDSLSANEVLLRINSQELSALDTKVNPGMTLDQVYWIRFSLENSSKKDDFFLEVDYPQLDYLQLFEVIDDSIVLINETGDVFPFNQRPVIYRNFAFKLNIPAGQTHHYLLNIDKRSSAVRFPLTIYSESTFWATYNKETIFYGFCFGFLALIFVISMLSGIRMKLPIFIWYAFYVLAFGLRCFAKLGYGYQYIIPDNPDLNQHFFPFTTQLSMIFLVLYIQQYFTTKKHLPRFHQVMNGVLWLFLVSSVLWILFPAAIVKTAPILITSRYFVLLLIITFAYSSAIHHLKVDAFKARIFLLGYSIFFLGIISEILIEFGAIEYSLIPLSPVFLGFFIEIGVFTYAMIILILKIISEKQDLYNKNLELEDAVTGMEKSQEENTPYLILRSKAVIDMSMIRFIQSDDHYLEFHLVDKERPEVDRNQLRELLTTLPNTFVQIHRSIIVNLNHIKSVTASNVLLKDGTELKLSRTFRSNLDEKLKSIQ